MQLEGNSNSTQKTLESNAILCVKIFVGKHRSREWTKKGIYACLVVVKVVEIRRRILVALHVLDLPKYNNNGRSTINNKNTTGVMHTHDDMTF